MIDGGDEIAEAADFISRTSMIFKSSLTSLLAAVISQWAAVVQWGEGTVPTCLAWERRGKLLEKHLPAVPAWDLEPLPPGCRQGEVLQAVPDVRRLRQPDSPAAGRLASATATVSSMRKAQLLYMSRAVGHISGDLTTYHNNSPGLSNDVSGAHPGPGPPAHTFYTVLRHRGSLLQLLPGRPLRPDGPGPQMLTTGCRIATVSAAMGK